MSKKFTPYPWGNDSSKPRGSSRVFPALPAAALAAAVILAACEPPATPTIVDPLVPGDLAPVDSLRSVGPLTSVDLQTMQLTFNDLEVRKSKMLVSTNGNAPQSFTNTLMNKGIPVTAGASYSITEKPASLTSEITVNETTGEVTFGAAALAKVNADGPQTVTVQAAYQGKTASYTFTVTDHFSPRRDHASAVLNGELYVIGGNGWDGSSSSEVWRSADGGRTWDQAADINKRFAGRNEHTLEVIGNALYILGGQDDGRNRSDDVWASTDRGVTWYQVATAARYSPRRGHSSAVLGNTLYVIAGSLKDPTAADDDIWRSTDLGAAWTRVTKSIEGVFVSALRFRLYRHASVVVENRVYVIGGLRLSAPVGYSNDVWRSPSPISAANGLITFSRSEGDVNWAQVATGTRFSARRAHSAVVLNGAIYVIGGHDAAFNHLDDVWKSTDQGVTWTQAAVGDRFSARSSHTSATLSGELYVIGGYRGHDGLVNDVWKSTDQGVTWTNVHANP